MENEKKIRIDIVVPLSGKGGVENVINQTACYLIKKGWHVRVVQMVYDGPAWLDAGVPFYPLRREKVNDILDFIPMYAQFMEQTYVPDLVVATPWPYMALAVKKALEQQSHAFAKVVSWLHGPLEIYKKYEVGGAECLGFADEVFVLNERTRTMLANILPDVSVRLVRNPVDFSRCSAVTPEHNRCLLFVGRLSPEKRVSLILDAIAASDGWRLKIIGNGEERERLAEQAERMNIAKRVEFLGWQSHPWECAKGADALVIASEYEAFPLVAIEAMACGLPVFSTPVDGIIELVRPGENGFLFAKDDSRELARLLDLYAQGRLPHIEADVCKKSAQRYEAGTVLQEIEQSLKHLLDKISVIIPCYNVSNCLSRCLESIFKQECDAYLEVICVDDKSTDNTLELLMEWEARYPEQLVVIPLEENGRQGRARNIALQYAGGNYVTYVDADDEVLPGYFQRLYDTMRENDCEVAGCGYRLALMASEEDVPVYAEKAVFDFENSVADMQRYLMCLAWKTSPWGRLYRTDFLRDNGILFAEGYFMEDILFSARCLKQMKRYAHIPEMLYLYRYNPDGTMASEKAKDYFLDTAVVQNMAADELLGCARFEDCRQEFAYAYFLKAFAEPMQRMWENPAFFSYEAYCYLKEHVKKRFPDIGENIYLRTTGEEELKVAFSFYRSDIFSAGMLWDIMGYDAAEEQIEKKEEGCVTGQYRISELAGVDFESAGLKNECIVNSREPVLIFANREVITGEELTQMLCEYPYMEQTDLLVLCSHAPETADWYGILMDTELEVYALIVRRELLASCGSFNFRLKDETNREFLCRAAKVCNPVFLECSDVNWNRILTDEVFRTNAYLLTRYLQPLKAEGCMEKALEEFVMFAERCGRRGTFEQDLSEMLAEDQAAYRNIYLATAPFFVIRGSDICYGVLQTFADQLAATLKKYGQRVIESEGSADNGQLELLKQEQFRGIIGFQATVLFQNVFDFVRGRRFNFWFDHPMFFHGLFGQSGKPMMFLCQDEDHADYINTYVSNAAGIQFPPGGVPTEPGEGERPYDISFMGTCFDEQKMWDVVNRQSGIMRELSGTCIEILSDHANMSYNELKEILAGMYPQVFYQYSFEEIANNIWEATRIAPYAYRRHVIEKILESGYELHVYGESWNEYPLKEGERLIIHEEVAPKDMAAEMRKSKISLNVMSWHKAGMTERIIEIMMSGSVCLTDETRYLKEHFSQMENIAMFRLDELEKLPGLIDELLSDEKKRTSIAEHAHAKVMAEHTWDVRARQLLELVCEMEEA